MTRGRIGRFWLGEGTRDHGIASFLRQLHEDVNAIPLSRTFSRIGREVAQNLRKAEFFFKGIFCDLATLFRRTIFAG